MVNLKYLLNPTLPSDLEYKLLQLLRKFYLPSIFRGSLFIFLTYLYTELVFERCVGTSTHDNLAWFFLISFYVFTPLFFLSRINTNGYNFLNIIHIGAKKDSLSNIINLIIAIGVTYLILSFHLSFVQYIDSPLIKFTFIGFGLFILISMFQKLVIVWSAINIDAMMVVFKGNIFEKIGTASSYTLMVTFMTLTLTHSMNANVALTLLYSGFIIIFFSPLSSHLIMKGASGLPLKNNTYSASRSSYQSGGNSGQTDFVIMYTFINLACQGIAQIFIIDFFINITREEILWMTILFSLPNMFILSSILMSIPFKKKSHIAISAISILFVFYTVIFSRNNLLW